MNASEITTSMSDVCDTWRYQGMTDSERELWSSYLARAERSDFVVALHRVTDAGSKRRPQLGEFAEHVRVAMSDRRRREEQSRQTDPWPEADPTVRDRVLAECREHLRRAGARPRQEATR